MKLDGKTVVMLKAVGVGAACGLLVGKLADILATRAADKEAGERYGAIASEYMYDVDGDVDVLSIPQVSPAFEKPDISKIVDYTKFSKKPDKADGDEAPEVEPEPVAVAISQEEFLRATGNGDGYVSVVGTWFGEDRVLAGWNEDLAEKDVESNLGWDVISAFDDPEVGAVYARNDSKKVLYEIVRGVGSYSEQDEAPDEG